MDEKKPENQTQFMPIGMCLGLSIGVAISAGMDNIPVGMCLGLSIGMCLGTAIDHANRNKKDEE